MKTTVAIAFLGIAALCSADQYTRMRRPSFANTQNYAQPLVTVDEETRTAEHPSVETVDSYQEQPQPVTYRTAVKHTPHRPIHVSSESASGGYYGSSMDKDDDLRLVEEQNKNAKYAFAAAVDDGIMDHSHTRQEVRDGTKVEGSYAYTDGYVRKTVNYVADENGYRVVSETFEEIGETGPQVDLVNGRAEVHTQIGGVDNQYSVSADEIPLLRKNL